jgi:acyl carrier protein
MSEPTIKHSVETLRSWLAARVAAYVQRPLHEIQPNISLAEYGLTSVYALTLVGEIEDHLGLAIDPMMMWDHPTLDALTDVLLQALGQAPGTLHAAP